MPDFTKLKIEIHASAAIVRFVNPAARNPLSIDVLENLHTLLDEFAVRADIERLIFTGTNDVFASGANLREIAEIKAETAEEFAWRGQSLMKKIAASPQLTIAAVNGYCFGGALDLALSCEKRIASPGAVFSHPGANLGIITGWGGTQRLPRLVGEARALEMFLTAERVDAQKALRIGLIDAIAENPLRESFAFGKQFNASKV